jgi:alginate O-acetyltransferase complex protein AlgI
LDLRLAWHYLLLWPGMDPGPFRSPSHKGAPPTLVEWFVAVAKMALGAVLMWGVARIVPPDEVVVRGWIILVGLGLALHCGLFHAVALAWRAAGIPVEPIMNAPLRAHSVSAFWGGRWNLAFRDVAYRFVFRPSLARFGAAGAGRIVFLFSGMLHELAISLPAQGGFGLPFLYFMIQSMAVELEHSSLGRHLGLRRGWRGWLFAALVVVSPAGLLFHRPWLENVVLPLACALGAA